MVSNNRESDLVLVDYQALIDDASSPFLLNSIETAFGAEGIGIIGIRNVPNFIALKDQVLHQAHPLAHLPEESLKELEDPDSMYNSGWSHGKEMLKPGTPDLAKGSFYFNPIIDVPRPEDQQAYPLSYPINKWPRSNLSELEPACKTLGKLMKDVAVKISKHIDNFARIKNPNCQEGIRDKLVHTEKVKGRLLYYFPLSSNTEKNQSEDSWIGWHNDSGFLTALAGDLYMTKDGTPVDTPPPSSPAGLHVVTRNGQTRKVIIPKDCMAIQIGECTQIVTGGAVVATPHCVRGVSDLARSSLACFIDVPPAVPLSVPTGSTPEFILAMESSKVPSMAKRWTNHMTFGEFLQKTFQAYYERS